MDNSKEIELVTVIFEKMTKEVSVVPDAENVYTFAGTLAERVVLAIRSANANVHVGVCASFLCDRLNRFDGIATQNATIEKAIEISALAAQKCDASLATLELVNAPAPVVNGESLAVAGNSPPKIKRSKRNALGTSDTK